jgi:DNA repair exonuclease SbcCD ATPase subunit
MYVNFISLKFKNINSYGNSITEFSFQKGMNLIAGTNGKGKSTIVEALCFCLFGVPFRKIKIKELINRTNKKKLWTNVTFKVGNDTFEITRSLKPDTLKISKNDKDLDILSSKKLNQDEIDKIIGLDINLFRQIISLSINYSKPFLSLASTEKKDIIENIFNIKVFGLMNKMLKTINSGYKIEWDINNRTINILEDNIKSMRNQIKKLKHTKENFEKDKEKDILKCKTSIDNLKQKINDAKTSIDELKIKSEKLLTEIIKEKSTDKDIIVKDIGSLDSIIKNSKKDISFFNNNDSCSICKSDFSGEHKNKHLNELNKTLNEAKDKKIELTEKLETIEEKLEIKKQIDKDITKNNNEIKSENNKVTFYDEELRKYIESLSDLENKTFTFDIKSLEDEYEQKKSEYKEVFKKTNDLHKEIVINETIFDILSNEGIKSHFFAKLIPILNKRINEYLTDFDIPISLTFNAYMEEEITSLGQYKGINYHSFSEGEKKRIDIAILLSFIETTKLISNWGTNILFFDELLDSSTDDDGIHKIMESIKNLIIKDNNLCVFIMTHKTSDFYYDSIYKVTMDAGFSQIN